VERSFISPHACAVNHCGLPRRALRSDKSGYQAARAVTKEVLWILALLSSLGVWAALWAAAASLASAWLQ
jgi:hypothetical protein